MKEITIHRGKTETTPESVNYSPRSIEWLDAHFSNLVTSGKLQGASYLLARKGKIFACASMGNLTADEETGDLMPDSIRQTASMSKVFTATAVMQLVEQGKLYIEQPVMEIIEEFNTSAHKHITIFNLLTHTSGIAGSPGYFCEPYPYEFPDYFDKDWITNGLRGLVQAKPGEAWIYSSYGFAILGEIVSRVSGTCFHDYVTEQIITPLGMDHTFYIVP
jgi:CubicO group peptidase (beta-lactamase class C family)